MLKLSRLPDTKRGISKGLIYSEGCCCCRRPGAHRLRNTAPSTPIMPELIRMNLPQLSSKLLGMSRNLLRNTCMHARSLRVMPLIEHSCEAQLTAVGVVLCSFHSKHLREYGDLDRNACGGFRLSHNANTHLLTDLLVPEVWPV